MIKLVTGLLMLSFASYSIADEGAVVVMKGADGHSTRFEIQGDSIELKNCSLQSGVNAGIQECTSLGVYGAEDIEKVLESMPDIQRMSSRTEATAAVGAGALAAVVAMLVINRVTGGARFTGFSRPSVFASEIRRGAVFVIQSMVGMATGGGAGYAGYVGSGRQAKVRGLESGDDLEAALNQVKAGDSVEVSTTAEYLSELQTYMIGALSKL